MQQTKKLDQYPIPVHRTTLDNGLTVITGYTGSKFAYVNLCFNSGASRDGEFPGTAHYLEHVISRGDDPNGVSPRLHALRVSGAESGAETGYHHSRYWCESYASDVPDVISGVIGETFLDGVCAKYLEVERKTIAQEARDRMSGSEFDQWLQMMAFPDHPEIHHFVGGSPEQVDRITSTTLEEYCRRNYVPANALLTVTGGVDHQRVLDVVDATGVGSMLGGDRAPKIHYRNVSGRNTFFGKTEDVGLLIEFEAPPPEHEDRVTLLLAMRLLSLGHESLFMQRLRHRDNLVYYTQFSFDDEFSHRAFIRCGATPENHDAAEQGFLEEIDRVCREDYSDELLRHTRAVLVRGSLQDQEGDMNISAYPGWSRHLTDDWVRGQFRYPNWAQAVLKPTKEDVSAAAEKYLDPARASVTRVLRRDA